MKKEEIKKIMHFLKDNDYLQPGFTIDNEVLCPLIGCEDVNSLEYIGPLILLVKEIEKTTGLFCKTIDKSIHIYNEDDCAFISKKRAEKAERITKDTYNTLLKTDISNISSQERRSEHLHQVNVFCLLSRNSKLILSKMEGIEED